MVAMAVFQGIDLSIMAVGGGIVIFLAIAIIIGVANLYSATNSEPPEVMMGMSSMNQAYMTNIRTCMGDDENICLTTLDTPTVYVYWEVENGIGCCNTFNCDYQAFINFCGTPFTEYKLYDIGLDGILYPWGNEDTWDYTCSNSTPWNYYYFYDVSVGNHTITIYQKDCQNLVETRNINFEIIREGDVYAII